MVQNEFISNEPNKKLWSILINEFLINFCLLKRIKIKKFWCDLNVIIINKVILNRLCESFDCFNIFKLFMLGIESWSIKLLFFQTIYFHIYIACVQIWKFCISVSFQIFVILFRVLWMKYSFAVQYNYTPFLWYRRFYDTAVFILSVPMHCSATRRFFYLYIHKHNSHIYRNVWSFCPNVLNFCKYTYFYLFLRNSGHFYFTLIPCFVKCPIIKP